jgi:hypothetical protein
MGTFGLVQPEDKDVIQKLDAALQILAKHDFVCMSEHLQYPNASAGFRGVTPRTIKEINPSAKVYEYWNLCVKPEWDTDWGKENPEKDQFLARPWKWRMQCPLTWSEIESKDWWLRDGNGNPVKEPSRDDVWFLDVGKDGFKEAYLEGLLKRIEGKGYDGIFFDYWWWDIKYILTRQGMPMPANYRTNDEWFSNAWKPFVEYVITGVRRAGYRVIGNCVGEYGDTESEKLWQRSMVDGTNYEMWSVGFNGEWLPGSEIARRMDSFSRDPMEVLVTNCVRDTDPLYAQKSEVGLAMYYIALPEVQVGRSYGIKGDGVAHWLPLWDMSIGIPSEPAVRKDNRYFWSRKYSRGLVLLNYESSTSVSYVLDGSYKDAEGKIYTGSVTLPPHTAMILASQ